MRTQLSQDDETRKNLRTRLRMFNESSWLLLGLSLLPLAAALVKQICLINGSLPELNWERNPSSATVEMSSKSQRVQEAKQAGGSAAIAAVLGNTRT